MFTFTGTSLVLEALASKSLAPVGGALYAALLSDCAPASPPDGVLEGTVRRLLLEVCEREGIAVVLAPPTLADAGTWEGALISSTSRLLLPIDELYAPADGAPSGAADLLVRFADKKLTSKVKAMYKKAKYNLAEHASEVGLS